MAEEKNKEELKYIIRVANTDLQGKQPLYHALTKIKGVSFMFSNAICYSCGFDKFTKAGHLTEEQINKLNDIINNPQKYKIPSWLYNRRRDPESGEDLHLNTNDLKFVQDNDIKNMKKVKLYRGVRHILRLPVRGQKTKSNFRKNKGKVTSVKKKK